MQKWQLQKAKEIDGVLSECKRELATNFDCPSEQILGFYGAKLRINSQEMLEAIYRYNQRTREQGSTLESPCAGCGKTPQTCICGSAHADFVFDDAGDNQDEREYADRADEQGSTLTPVVAILTVFSVGAVLIAQSGLVNALLARFAQVVQ